MSCELTDKECQITHERFAIIFRTASLHKNIFCIWVLCRKKYRTLNNFDIDLTKIMDVFGYFSHERQFLSENNLEKYGVYFYGQNNQIKLG